VRLGLLTEERAEEIRQDALQLMREGIAAAEAEPPADPSLVFEHAYADPPPSLLAERDELRRILGG
jgi:TPP-dependent pyruvate/acetoin dehydrogenase alpha subunit